MTSINEVIKHALNVIPGVKFYNDMITFIRHPEIYDGIEEYTPLKNALGNLLKSTLAISVVITLIKWSMLNNSLIANLELVINPLVLYISLFSRAIVISFIFWSSVSILSFATNRKISILYFLQTLQVWSVLNPLGIILFWVALNRVIENGNSEEAVNSLDFLFGIGVSTCSFILIYKLLLRPVYIHLKYVLRIKNPLITTLTGISIAFISNIYLPNLFSKAMINEKSMCSLLYQKQKEKLLNHSVTEAKFMFDCLRSSNGQ